MSTAIEYIINVGLETIPNITDREKAILKKINEKEFTFVISLWIYFRQIEWLHQMVKIEIIYLNIV